MLSEVRQAKGQDRIEESITQAWLTEYFHRVKNLPSLQEAIEMAKPKQEVVMTSDEMMKTVMLLNAKFGGKVEEGKAMED